MDRVLSAVQGLEAAITWISPIACSAVASVKPEALPACQAGVATAKTLKTLTDQAVAAFQGDPSQTNAQSVLDMLMDLEAAWKVLDAGYKGSPAVETSSVQRETRIHPFRWSVRRFFKDMIAPSEAWAAPVPVRFQWNASTGSVAGYKLYQGATSGTYTSSVTLPGTATTGAMDLDDVSSHYVAATAYDAGNRESAFSNEILCHPVTVTASSGGTISPSGSFFVQNGNAVTFSVTPDSNYRVKNVVVNGQDQPGPIYTAASVSAKTTVRAEFELIPPPPPPTDLQLQVLQQIAKDVSRIARVFVNVDPEE